MKAYIDHLKTMVSAKQPVEYKGGSDWHTPDVPPMWMRAVDPSEALALLQEWAAELLSELPRGPHISEWILKGEENIPPEAKVTFSLFKGDPWKEESYHYIKLVIEWRKMTYGDDGVSPIWQNAEAHLETDNRRQRWPEKAINHHHVFLRLGPGNPLGQLTFIGLLSIWQCFATAAVAMFSDEGTHAYIDAEVSGL